MAGIADELVERTARFVREQVIPLEQDARWGAHGPSSNLVEALRAAARRAGPVAPHLAQEDRPALSMRAMAEVFRAAGYWPLGQNGRAHVCTPDTLAPFVCLSLLAKKTP